MKRKIVLILQVATVGVFLGRAWQHLVWDAPFRALLWDEHWMKGIVKLLFGMSWDEYITSPIMDAHIQRVISGFGWFYLICAFMAVMIYRWRQLARVILILGSISLVFLALLYCKEKFFSLGQLFEYSLQFGSPLFLVAAVNRTSISPRLLFFMKLATALTFVCHGLYAFGYYPRPGHFTQMTMNILGMEESQTVQLLIYAGIMDFIIGIGIFLPWRISKWIILYTIIWGFLTTLARVVSYVELEYFWETAKQWVHESVYRVPHFLLPIALYLGMLGRYGNVVRPEKT